MSYHQASVYSSDMEDYVLKINGQGWYDTYIQLPNPSALHTWEQCFNQRKPDYVNVRRTALTSEADISKSVREQTTHDMLESSLSQDYLLSVSHDEASTITNVNTTTDS